jgi:pimeloyl-ACP methyl ester carboxylesterase
LRSIRTIILLLLLLYLPAFGEDISSINKPLADYLKLFENKAVAVSDNKKYDLLRKGRIGVMVTEITDEIRAKSGLPEKKGVSVKEVFPDTSAIEGGIKKEDIILEINGAEVVNVPQFLSLAGTYRAGEELTLSLWRNSEKITKKITLKPFPEENHPDFDILYLSVPVDETTTLRTIVTKPKNGTKHPAVLLIQGLSCVSVDYPFDNSLPYQNAYKSILYSLTEKGFVTMRVEKSGIGDSTGTPAKDIDFNREVLGFQKALEVLKSYDFVDKDKVFIFGHSMGGVMAPVIANNIIVKGIIVFGTIGRPMVEYELENDFRQHLLRGEDFVNLEQEMRKKEAFLYHFYIEKLTPGEIIEKYPDCKDYFDDENHMYGRHYMFLQQLYDLNLSEKWKNVNTDVLAIWGKSDFVSAQGDHKLIADIVNNYHNGKGTFMEIENIDHYFLNASSMLGSYKNITEKKNDLQFNPVIIEKIYEWMKNIMEKDSNV